MATARFALYRPLGAFWLSAWTVPLHRLAESRAYEAVLAILFAAGLCVVAAGAVYLPFVGRQATGVAWFVLGALALLAFLLLSTSRGRTVVRAAPHADAPDAVLARCRELLERHGFRVVDAAPGVVRAVRGDAAVADGEWRGVPLEARCASTAAERGAALEVRCTVGGGAVLDDARRLAAATCEALAALDGRALDALDAAPVLRQRAWFLGGLAGTVFNALAWSTMLGVVATAALAWFVASRALELQANALLNERARSVVYHVQQSQRLPLRLQAEALVERIAAAGAAPAAAVRERLAAEAARAGLAVGLRGPGDKFLLLHPPAGDASHVELARVLAERMVWGLARSGDRVVARLGRRDTAAFEAKLGLERGTLVLANVLSNEEMARRLPRVRSVGGVTDVTFYDGGRPIVRYAWDEKGAPRVDTGTAALPRDVLLSRMRLPDDEDEGASLRQLLGGGEESLQGITRTELRDGVPFRVLYRLREAAGAGSGWRGYAYAAPSASFGRWAPQVAYPAAVVAVLGLLAIAFAVQLASFVVARRMSRPVIEVRDALKAIAAGNYAVRVAATRSDEIGQLQRLLNVVAEELRRRESMKDLFGKYLSKQVAEQILTGESEAGLSGARREVSVLFADVRGFTAYAERHDPEQVTRSLNEYFEVMVDVVAAHEGVLDKYIGDGIMVVFGAPVPQADHARRAVVTALEMQAALQSLNLKRMQRGDAPIAIGVGVNTGVAISGNLGSLKRMEFTVIGDTVNLAARLESRAAQGQILIGRTTYEKVADFVEAEPLGPMTVKGKSEAVEIWAVTGLKARA